MTILALLTTLTTRSIFLETPLFRLLIQQDIALVDVFSHS
jgi:hypothetical protein